MAGAKFRGSYRGIGQMIRSPMMEAEMARRAGLIRARAQTNSPVQTGEYKESFRVESGRRGGRKNDRAFGRVVNDSQHAFYVEYGTTLSEAHHTLLNAAAENQD